MQTNLQIVSRTVVAIILLAIILVAIGATIDEGLRRQLTDIVDEQLNDWASGRPVVTQLRSELKQSQDLANALKIQNAELRRRLSEVSSNLEQVNTTVEQERSQLNSEFDRLKGKLQQEVSSREIAIEQVRDKYTVIRVGDKVLFDTASSELKQRGREVLGLIAVTLKNFSDRQVRVEGHTDNIPIVSSKIKKRFPTNWELSSARATSAVRHLIENGGLDSKWVVAVGRGEHHPVASNKTKEGRAKNRRIEIVLMPAEDTFRTQAFE